MTIKVCVAGATGWTGSLVCKAVLASQELQLVGAIARRQAGQDIGQVLGVGTTGVRIVESLEEAAKDSPDVLVDFTKPDSVKARTLAALSRGIHVVIGTSGLAAADFEDIESHAQAKSLGVIAAGNFSITAALAKHVSLIAAKYLPSWEIIDYAQADKIDAPSGTARELAEEMAKIKRPEVGYPTRETVGHKDARGTSIDGTQVHSIRLPGYVIAFETLFGLPHERLTIRHDSGTGAEPYVHGTLLAIRKVTRIRGMIRGLDKLLFD